MHATKFKVGFAKSLFSYQTYLCDATQGTDAHNPPPPKMIPSFFLSNILGHM